MCFGTNLTITPTLSGRVKRSWQEFSADAPDFCVGKMLKRKEGRGKTASEDWASHLFMCGDRLRCVSKDITNYSCLPALCLKYIK